MHAADIDILWVVLCSGLVFLMQAGFLCLESGLTRSKNAVNVALKNLVDFAVAVALYWLFGFGLMFGASAAGLIGTDRFMAPVGQGAPGALAAFFLFQAVFCSTAATIVSGAVAERMRFAAYLAVAALVGGLIYPVFGHWAWGGGLGGAPGWLAAIGFVDFAGSTAVHSVGGWVSLAAVLIIGPRRGRFDAGGVQPISGGNLPLSMLGAMLLLFGWFGFNGGSTLALDARVPGVLVNTLLGAVAGVLAALAASWWMRGYADVVQTLNGTIAGLVAVTAGAHAFSAAEALLVGGGGALVMILCNEWLLHRRIDDAVGAIPAHLAAGVWGTLAVALFGDPAALGTGLGAGEQFFVQFVGVVACGTWSFGVAWLLLKCLDRLLPLRVTPEHETLGLNVSEHGARTELLDLLEAMEVQERTGQLAVRVPVEPFTEVGQIAASYNRVMDALERAVAQTRNIIRDVRDGIITFNREGLLRSLNPGAEKLFGVAAGQAIGLPISRLLGDGQVVPEHQLRRLMVAGDKTELRLHRRGAPPRVLEVSVSESAHAGELLFTGLVRDVTDRRSMEEQLQRERDLAQVTLASIGDGVITTDEAGLVQYLNPTAEQLTGWTSEEARGHNIAAIYRLEDEGTGAVLENPVRTVLAHGREIRRSEHGLLLRRDGERVPVQDTAAPIRNRLGYLMGVVLVFHDVTVTLQLTRELTLQASQDALTGVPNRREFERRLGELIERPPARGVSHVLCYLDLDQFKVVNDTCGHVAGDELLRQVTALLSGRLRSADLLARLGGDEFGVIFFNCPVEKATEMAEGLREAIRDFRFAWEGKVFAIGVSIGLVPVAGNDLHMGRLLSAADAACYAAKEGGRNRVHVYRPDDDLLMEQHGQMQWVSRLHDALEGDRLRLYAQPIVPLEPGRAIHYEILVRLEEEGRIVSPGSFIPAAERYNLMPRIDDWVFRNVLAWVSDTYRQCGRVDATWCINLSGNSLNDERLLEDIRARLARAALPAGAICFEITESSAVANLSRVVSFIGEVKRLGCAFALDDFGSGLSSFAYLKNLPVDYLKIDGSFIRDIVSDPSDRAMVEAINTIGHTMGLATVAEFVEDEAILRALEEIGIDYAQGYHVGMPRPLAELGRVRMMPR
ncbi:ammonia permease [Azoarcus olearius]|uniref:ammonium transporter n=1 Tax=Azoarcus sp. (strain BH72) TaxID=418699 RepID=UPI0008060D76|nr:ammonium transporter [Azoarcus olearius]ANQ86047.1 ammonia permease [Azoarcus olearius]